jgi:hypothetical protein
MLHHFSKKQFFNCSNTMQHLALQPPFLWRNICLGLCSHQIREYLSCSQSVGLAITFDVVDKDLCNEDSYNKYSYNEYYNEDYDKEDPREIHEAFMAHLTRLIYHVSQWHSFHANCKSAKTFFTILGFLGDLSAPCLNHVSVQLHSENLDINQIGMWPSSAGVLCCCIQFICVVSLCQIVISLL